MQFRILGSLAVSDRDGRNLGVGGPKQRALLAVLLLHANRIVPISRLIDALWGDDPPESARHSVHLLVHRLRRMLGDGHTDAVVRTQGSAYLLQLPPGQLDAEVFERLVADAQAAAAVGEHVQAVERYDDALALWHGPPLADLHDAPFAQPAIARLDGLHAAAAAGRAETALALGQHTELVPVLGELVRRYPLQERLYRLLILALYRSGRQAEALATYRSARETLVEQLGIEPSDELRQLHKAIVTQDAALAAAVTTTPPAPVTPPPPTPARGPAATARGRNGPRRPHVGTERRVVTVMVVKVQTSADSGGDPEDLWAARTKLVDPVREQVECYGAVLDAEVGGTLLAAFGARRVRADDPERAVRAALAICTTLGGPLADSVRVGVETGEAMVALPSGPDDAPEITGDVVHGAVALAARAPAGGVLVSPATWAATRHAVKYQPAGASAEGNGQDAAGGGWLAVTARPPGSDAAGGPVTPLIGREHELVLLGGLLERLHQVQEPQLVTVVGPSGIGKTRLLGELRRRAAVAGDPAVWQVGRCLPYSEGVPYRPLAEVVRGLLGITTADSAGEAERKLGDAVERLLDGGPAAARVAAGLEPLVLPHAAGGLAGQQRDAFAAWRTFLESLGRAQPLVLVFEDLHWADGALLDAIEGLAQHAEEAPLLIACLAWPELLDRRPGWGGGQRHATTLSLQPLTHEYTRQLFDQLLGDARLRWWRLEQALAGAGGNPLFAEEYARMIRDRGSDRGGGVGLPPPRSVRLLIAARLDGLDPADRTLLTSAAVLGQTVWVGALAAMSGREPGEVAETLRRAARLGLLRRARRSSIPGEVEYAFRHALVRDVAYGRLLRGERAEQHRRAAGWLERAARDRAELIAHHDRQALHHAPAAEQPDNALPPRAAQLTP